MWQTGSIRHVKDRLFVLIGLVCTLVAIVPLFAILSYIVYRGWERFDLSLFLELPPPPLTDNQGNSYIKGGVGNAILGSVYTVTISALIAIPWGMLLAFYLDYCDCNKWLRRLILLMIDVLTGLPAIIVGIFAYGLLVQTHLVGYSSVAGGIALSVLFVPVISKSTFESIKSVPNDLKLAAYSLGANRFQVFCKVTIPCALTGIFSGITLGIGRVAGETAPLLFTTMFSPFWPEGILKPIATLPVLIFNYATVPYRNLQDLAASASLLLILLVLGSNLIARLLLVTLKKNSFRE
jgi:phosphate transport system permease protein